MVVIVTIPELPSYTAVLIPNESPVVATPTILVIDPLTSKIGLITAPIRGAYPNPITVFPIETGTPPLGN